MPVGELFLSAFLQVLFDRLASRELLQFLRQEGLYSEIKKWEDTLEDIQTVLGDAEEKQLTDRAVKIWLDDLQDLAYDVEDMLDEFATEAFAGKLKMQQQEATKFWKLYPACFSNWSPGAIKFSSHMRSNVKDVTSRLDQLCKLIRDLGLEVITGGTSLDAALQRPPTSSHQTKRAVYGRDADKAKILEMVLKNEPTDANFLVIPIVGMGGVGKSTLAQEVFNDSEVKSFEVKGWVCVSNGYFDVTRISKSILEKLTGSSSSSNDLTTVQDQLKKEVMGKKFLLVLDDIWSMDYGKWVILQSPFTAGAPGSRIIVTTRLEDVALKMRPSGFYRLDLLHDEDCWLVFSMCASENGVIPTHLNIKSIRQEVIKKSAGLPLAARTLGGFLRSRKVDEWMEILDSKSWDFSANGDNPILPTLKLSYHHLPSHLKRCFAYCAIFPKDNDFEEEELVFLWMAQGLIQPSTRNMQPEELGREYIKELLASSMFQRSSSNYNSSKVAMHDLFHDLAQWAFGETNIRLDGESAASMQWRELKKVRHFSYTSDRFVDKNKFAVFQEAEDLKARVRTFLPMLQRSIPYPYITNWVPSNLLPKLKRLRVLSLRSYQIIELPNSIGGLKHLRYLNLSQTEIRSLPESTTLLYNLQSLMLRDCFRLAKLPSNFRYLTKLRHLDIRGAYLINEMPSGMKELESMQMLSDFIVGMGVGSNLKDLKSLEMLHGELRISRLDRVVDCDPEDLILTYKEDLKELLLEWGSEFDDSRNAVLERNVLDMLQPHPHLEKLTITCYGGTSFPSWVGHASFVNITVLRLQSCEKCTSLPALDLLPLLKYLTIKGMKILQRISCEIYGAEKPFQSLETLCFEDLPEWENWEPNKENKYVNSFPCLQELSIVNCPKLSGRLPDCLPSLEKFVIKRCEQLMISFSSLPLLCELEIDGCKGIVCNSPTDLMSLKSLTLADISGFGNWLRQQNFLKVEFLKLKIMSYEQLINLWQLNEAFLQKPPQGLPNFISITELQIENCSNLVSFPEVCFLLNLSSLEIINCDALTSLPKGMNDKNACLRSLKMKDCNSLTFIVRGKLPSSLKKLEIENCEKLEYLWDDNEESCTSVVDEEKLQCLLDDKEGTFSSSSISHLEELYIYKCPSLRWLPSRDQLSTTLTRLHISHCSKLTILSPRGQLPTTLKDLKIHTCSDLTAILSRGQLPEMLETLDIADCPKLKSIVERFHNNMSLRNVYIQDCPNLVFFPKPRLSKSNLVVWIDPDQNLKALARQMPITSLQLLELCRCPEMSIPTEGLPTNLTSLEIEGPNLYDSLAKWGLHKLTSLRQLSINGCPDALSFPEDEMRMKLPHTLTHLRLENFSNQKYMSSMGFPSLTSLEELRISYCPNLTSLPRLSSSISRLVLCQCPKMSFPTEGLPTNITSLEIEDSNLYEPLAKWDLHKLTFLRQLSIHGCPDASSFPEDEMRMKLPRTLTHLRLENFTELKDMSSLGFRNLTFLEELKISDCPNLTSLSRLSSSILRLDILNCPLLKKECKRDEGREWPNIAPIPCVVIDSKFIYDPEEEASAD